MRQHCRLQLVYRDLCEDQSYFLCCSSACIAMACSCVKGKRKNIMGLLSARMAWLLPCKDVVWYVREYAEKLFSVTKFIWHLKCPDYGNSPSLDGGCMFSHDLRRWVGS